MAAVSLMVSIAVVVVAIVLFKDARLPTYVDPWYASRHPTETMRAIMYDLHTSNPTDLRLDPAFPRPVPKDTQVLIKVAAASINPVDFKTQRNAVPDFVVPKPRIPGVDVSGEIAEVGASVNKMWSVGDRVAAMLPLYFTPWGGLAEYVAIDASLVARVGDNTDLVEAAAVPLVGLTVLQSFQKSTQKPEDYRGQKFLVQAGSGGVGTFAIQYAKNVLGMYVSTTASEKKTELLKSLGADRVIDYNKENFEEVINGYDFVLDPMSWAYEDRTLSSSVLKPSGHYMNVMSSDWSFQQGVEKVNNIPGAFARIIRHKVGSTSLPKYSMSFVHPDGKTLQKVLDLVDRSKIKVIVDKHFPLEDAASAFEYLQQGHAAGKVLCVL